MFINQFMDVKGDFPPRVLSIGMGPFFGQVLGSKIVGFILEDLKTNYYRLTFILQFRLFSMASYQVAITSLPCWSIII